MEGSLKARNHNALVPESKGMAASDQAFCPPHIIAGYAGLVLHWMDTSFNSYPLWVQSELSSLHHTSCL